MNCNAIEVQQAKQAPDGSGIYCIVVKETLGRGGHYDKRVATPADIACLRAKGYRISPRWRCRDWSGSNGSGTMAMSPNRNKNRVTALETRLAAQEQERKSWQDQVADVLKSLLNNDAQLTQDVNEVKADTSTGPDWTKIILLAVGGFIAWKLLRKYL